MIVRPFTRQRTVGFLIASQKTRIHEAAGFGIRPSGPNRIHKRLLADDAGVSLVRAIKRDAAPVHEFIARPGRRHAHRVVVVEHPRAPLGDATRAGVEANGDAFVSDVAGRDLERPEERRAEIHAPIHRTFFKLDHLGGLHAATVTLGQDRKIFGRDIEIRVNRVPVRNVGNRM